MAVHSLLRGLLIIPRSKECTAKKEPIKLFFYLFFIMLCKIYC